MNLGEFKAFIEGMGIDDAPTPEQWARICEKLEAVREPIYNPSWPVLPSPQQWPHPHYDIT